MSAERDVVRLEERCKRLEAALRDIERMTHHEKNPDGTYPFKHMSDLQSFRVWRTAARALGQQRP